MKDIDTYIIVKKFLTSISNGKSRETKKVYWAIVNENFPHNYGSLKNWMTRNNKQNKSKAHRNEVPKSKIAHLSFKRIYELDHYCVFYIGLYGNCGDRAERHDF